MKPPMPTDAAHPGDYGAHLIVLLCLGVVLWIALDIRYHRARTQTGSEPYCAWCLHRDGDTCTHPDSPPNIMPNPRNAPGECGPVCYGKVRCIFRSVPGDTATHDTLGVGAAPKEE